MESDSECGRTAQKLNPVLKTIKSDAESRDIILLNKHSTVGLQISGATEDTVRKKTKNICKSTISIRTPPPPAVARRNARERNRVKQVNNGFANLRQHIPNSIAAAFESGRSGNKKLSKVETLRMAVEYIRSLERLLELTDIAPSNSSDLSYQSSKGLERQSSNVYASSLTSPSSEDDTISTNSTTPPPAPPPLQYVKIGDSDLYHVIPLQFFGNNEHLKSIKIENDLLSNSTSMDSELTYKKVQLSSDINTNAALSPEIYSDSSLSPVAQCDIPGFIPVFNVQELSSQSTSKVKEHPKSANEEMHILCRNLIMLQADADVSSSKQPLNINELISW